MCRGVRDLMLELFDVCAGNCHYLARRISQGLSSDRNNAYTWTYGFI
jgi:hypothetical protein